MREIRFRAWKISGKYYFNDLYGFYFTSNGEKDQIHLIGSSVDKTFDSETIIIEQFTGLLDKSGVEIYEGDIIRGVEIYGFKNSLAEVRFGGGCFELYDGYGSYTPCLGEADNRYIEIIGNIHDNK